MMDTRVPATEPGAITLQELREAKVALEEELRHRFNESITEFKRRTGISVFSFDAEFLHYAGFDVEMATTLVSTVRVKLNHGL